ncbi:hypothetical protein ACR6C2_39765 [Streptomyces sp. INA 01156]
MAEDRTLRVRALLDAVRADGRTALTAPRARCWRTRTGSPYRVRSWRRTSRRPWRTRRGSAGPS